MGQFWIAKSESLGGTGTSLYKISNFNNLVFNFIIPIEELPSAQDTTESQGLIKILTNKLKLSFDYVLDSETPSPISGTTSFSGETSVTGIKRFLETEYGAVGKKSTAEDSFQLSIFYDLNDSKLVDTYTGLISGLTITKSKEFPITFDVSMEFTVGKPGGV